MCYSCRSFVSLFLFLQKSINTSTFSWLAELGPMFFTLKESNFSHKDKRRQDRETLNLMEKELQIVIDQQNTMRKVNASLPPSRSQIATPGLNSLQKRAQTPVFRKHRGL